MHGQFPRIPPCDLLILSGDIAPDLGSPFDPFCKYKQLEWLNTQLKPWLHTVQATEVVATPGNHDFAIQRLRHGIDDDMPWHLLIDQGVELFGLTIWGSPWVKDLPGWAFNLEEEQLAGRWARFPDNADILVLHGPPHEIWEWSAYEPHWNYRHACSKTLMQRIDVIQPRLVTFGHVHEARAEVQRDETTLVNVAVLNDEYRLCYKPYVTTLDLPDNSGVTSETLEV